MECDGGLGRNFLDQLAEEFSSERDERNPGVASDERHHAERGADTTERTGLRADDGRRLGLHHEAPERELERRVVFAVHATEATNLPGVERGERDAALLDVEREDARITSWGFRFEHRAMRMRERVRARGDERSQ